jgi:hypothetical protein
MGEAWAWVSQRLVNSLRPSQLPSVFDCLQGTIVCLTKSYNGVSSLGSISEVGLTQKVFQHKIDLLSE